MSKNQMHRTTLRIPKNIWRATKIEAIKRHYDTANKFIVALLLKECGRLDD